MYMPGIDKSIFGLLSMNQLRWYWYDDDDVDDDDDNDVDENDGVNVHDDYNHDNNYDVQFVMEMMMVVATYYIEKPGQNSMCILETWNDGT